MDGLDCLDKVGKAFRSGGMEPLGFELRQFYPEMFSSQQQKSSRPFWTDRPGKPGIGEIPKGISGFVSHIPIVGKAEALYSRTLEIKKRVLGLESPRYNLGCLEAKGERGLTTNSVLSRLATGYRNGFLSASNQKLRAEYCVPRPCVLKLPRTERGAPRSVDLLDAGRLWNHSLSTAAWRNIDAARVK